MALLPASLSAAFARRGAAVRPIGVACDGEKAGGRQHCNALSGCGDDVSVLENGTARFFRRPHELADFIEKARVHYRLSPPIAVGYSNGANMANTLLLLRPETLAGAILLRAAQITLSDGMSRRTASNPSFPRCINPLPPAFAPKLSIPSEPPADWRKKSRRRYCFRSHRWLSASQTQSANRRSRSGKSGSPLT